MQQCNMVQVERTARTFPGFDKAEAVVYLGHVDFPFDTLLEALALGRVVTYAES